MGESRVKDMKAFHQRGGVVAKRLAEAKEAEDRNYANALLVQRKALRIQRQWRARKEVLNRRLRAVLMVQFRVRRWLKRRRTAAKKIQMRWSFLGQGPVSQPGE